MVERKAAIGLGVAAAAAGAFLLLKGKRAEAAPVPADLFGKVTDSITGAPIGGASITLTGAFTSLTTSTDLGGNYTFLDLAPGKYSVSLSMMDYETEVVMVVLTAGVNELNVQMVPISAALANLSGVVTDAETGSPLMGVKVTIDGLTAKTNADGVYQFTGLAPGDYTVIFEKAGYETVIH